jgi:hypothetical protein
VESNTLTAAKKKSSPFFLQPLSALLPTGGQKGIAFWYLLPSLFLLITLSCNFLFSLRSGPYLPFILLFSSFLTIFFKKKGVLSCCFAFLLLQLTFYYSHIGFDLVEALIFGMLALNLVILSLCLEEGEALLTTLQCQADHSKSEAEYFENAFLDAKQQGETQEKELMQEIERLKEEARQRQIEKVGDQRKIELILSEIEWLTRHKDTFITDSRKARELAAAYKHQLENHMQSSDHLTSFLKEQLIIYQEKVIFLQQQVDDPQRREEMDRLKNNLNQAKEMVSDLQIKLESEINQRAQLASSLEEELNASQEQIAKLEQQLQILQEKKADNQGEELIALKQLHAQVEGNAKQIRMQFQQKSEILNITRKELFKAEEKLLAFERENYLIQQDLNYPEIDIFVKDMTFLVEELDQLRTEINLLEGLVSHTLSQ